MSGAGISKHLKNAEIEQLLDDLASYARSDVEHLDFIQSDTDSEGESDDIYNLGSGNAVHVPVSVDDDYFVWEDMENFSNNTEEFMCDLGSLVNFNSIFRGMFGTANVADHLLIKKCYKSNLKHRNENILYISLYGFDYNKITRINNYKNLLY
ncbi:uncharacterized protein LOC142334490 isoform X2 [Lycorma delicatula]|uniref:uncharacterized protein LOC142334490 isoform X2 n=1 Tax=Lycorma delicatula TaxID=130591 RepID=UPI003F51463E